MDPYLKGNGLLSFLVNFRQFGIKSKGIVQIDMGTLAPVRSVWECQVKPEGAACVSAQAKPEGWIPPFAVISHQ